ncbi:2-oxoglutarate ferredoxin oxidoreductase subunit alpha [Desulfobaculum xiamenense]|uniref:2-oxoglutarate ferredoxin oxidoreductase subunit alpha n=1 Tax=Desulfobaculum xiamenense TaxID=995050 RepID=A0A846QQL5_9BACT|nr:2-oxoacid:acceptor oxidoreductase subunit alpha [Desulfobaculum xiamenense]NJB66949.1 2-oxoglutarate ferredoxin oxidoreductase subunit alpha [Desulfobaculum xiamenense]
MSERGVNVVIGGAAGQGLATVGRLLAKALMRAGYNVAVSQVYMSRIRGGHNTFAIRAGTAPVGGPDEEMDLLVALNQEAVDLNAHALRKGGLLLLDAELDAKEAPSLSLPLAELAPEAILRNVAGLGVVGALLGLGQDVFETLLSETFARKGETVVARNHAVLAKAYEWAYSRNVPFAALPEAEPRTGRLLMNGNDALALGAMAAGANFCSFYPMTPGTSIAQALISHGAELGVVVEQAEDEIAAINMALGASYAGARAIVPTSGGGFALMTEGLSLAAVAETPIVCAVAQRPGPATGLPTHTEQADLNLVLHAGHGEFPRAVLAPGSVEDCFHLAHRAIDQAELHQSPVIILTDQHLADSLCAVDAFDLDALPPVSRPATHAEVGDDYERYAETESGVSPRLLPGFGPHVVVADSHEHRPDGHITEDPDIRVTQNEKRLRKGLGLWRDALPPQVSGDESPDLLLVCWGSSGDAVREAASVMRGHGVRTGVVHFTQVWPLRADAFLGEFDSAREVVCVESNATGQFAALLRRETGFGFSYLVLRHDGLPLTARYIVDRLDARVCSSPEEG